MNTDKIFQEYFESDFYKAREFMMKLIQDKFEQYDLYQGLEIYSDKNPNEFKQYIKQKVNKCTRSEGHIINEMCKMFSETNCDWQEYYIANLVHESLIELWYPKD